MAESEGNGTIKYNVKDLLTDINKKLDRVIDSLGQKADRSDVHELKGRVAAVEKQLEISRLLASSREETKEKGLSRFQTYVVIISSLASTAAIAATAFAYFH